MPFSEFYLIFYLIFRRYLLLKNHEKGGFTCRMTWQAAADVARGTASRCDAALRPRGRARVARTGAGGADAWQEATQTDPR